MIDALLNTLDHAVQLLLGILGPELSVALLVGLLFSGLSTYFVKATPGVVNSERRILYTRLWSVGAAFVPTFLLYYGAPMDKRILVSLVAGFAAPLLYRITVWAFARKFGPAARANLSGDPMHNFRSNDDEETGRFDPPVRLRSATEQRTQVK